MKKLRKNKKGFTLVELVVVIAILAILASTATVATIAILNNARKTPVSDAAGKLKDQINYYAVEDAKDYPDTLAGFTKYLSLQLPDVKVDTTIKSSVTAASDDDIHICLDKNSNLRGQKWTATVYTKYYKCAVTFDYKTTDKSYSITVGSVDKF